MGICIQRRERAAAAFLATSVLSIWLVLLGAAPAPANERLEAEQLVQEANLVFQEFMCDESLEPFRDLIRDAKGVMIIPSWLVDASDAKGVLLTRDTVDGDWRGPAFYSIGGADFDPQLEGRSLEVILLIVTENGVKPFLRNGFKIGGGVKANTVPLGMGGSEARANLSADILAFSRCKKLYGGISLDGAVVAVRPSLNVTYYKGNSSPTDIFARYAFENSLSGILVGSIAKAANERIVKRECAAVTGSEKAGGVGLQN